MSERKALHVVLTTVLGLFITASAQADNAAPDVAAPAYTLQSLKELDGKPPAHRTMNIQTWKTAEGTKVLFVEARELPIDRKSVV